MKKKKRNRKDIHNKKIMYPPIDCICPKCRITFKHKFEWGYRGRLLPPRIYCDPCREAISGIDNSANMERRSVKLEFLLTV